MTGKHVLAASLVSAAAVAGVAVLPASGQDTVDHETLTFTTVEKRGEEHFVDLRPKGSSPGDRYVLSTTLRRAGAVAGRIEADCVLIDKAFGGLGCTNTAILAGGRLTFQGVTVSKRIPGVGGTREEYAVTGGTGDYEGAAGTVLRTGDGKRDTLTVSLVR